MPTTDPSPRRAKYINQHKVIEAQATSLVVNRGYNNVTVEDIAEASGISKRTFFNYFQSKQEAVLGKGPRSINEFERSEFLQTDHEDLPKAVLRLCLEIAHDPYFDIETAKRRKQILDQNASLRSANMAKYQNLHPQLTSLVEEYLGLKSHLRNTELDVRVEANLVCHVVFAAILTAVDSTPQQLSKSNFNLMCEHMLAGIESMFRRNS